VVLPQTPLEELNNAPLNPLAGFKGSKILGKGEMEGEIERGERKDKEGNKGRSTDRQKFSNPALLHSVHHIK